MGISTRQLKREVRKLLIEEDLETALAKICQMTPRRVVNPLFGLLNDREEMIRWRAVTAMGRVVSQLADANLESARVVMRRFIWTLNDESGGIGWGSPESMGAIMAQSPVLAREFSQMIVSYVRVDMNYLEHPVLQRGVLWGLLQLVRAEPSLGQNAAGFLTLYLESPDPILRGLAAAVARALNDLSAGAILAQLADDQTQIDFYDQGRMQQITVAQLAS